jgi:hypothetical protein
MAEANNTHYARDLAADYNPLHSMSMGQTQSDQAQIDGPLSTCWTSKPAGNFVDRAEVVST